VFGVVVVLKNDLTSIQTVPVEDLQKFSLKDLLVQLGIQTIINSTHKADPLWGHATP
jgi:hypothetical protein